MTSFSHFYNQEPHPRNHMIPHYGLFSKFYFSWYCKIIASDAKKFTSFKQNSGPPFWNYNPWFDALEHNEYLNWNNIDPELTKFKGEHWIVPTLSHTAHH